MLHTNKCFFSFRYPQGLFGTPSSRQAHSVHSAFLSLSSTRPSLSMSESLRFVLPGAQTPRHGALSLILNPHNHYSSHLRCHSQSAQGQRTPHHPVTTGANGSQVLSIFRASTYRRMGSGGLGLLLPGCGKGRAEFQMPLELRATVPLPGLPQRMSVPSSWSWHFTSVHQDCHQPTRHLLVCSCRHGGEGPLSPCDLSATLED